MFTKNKLLGLNIANDLTLGIFCNDRNIKSISLSFAFQIKKPTTDVKMSEFLSNCNWTVSSVEVDSFFRDPKELIVNKGIQSILSNLFDTEGQAF